MARKIRGDSKLDQLPDEAFSALRDWFAVENVTYVQAQDRLREQYGVETSMGALTNFFQNHCVGFKLRKARDFAEEVGKVIAEGDNQFGETTIELIKQKAFERAAANEASIEDLVSFMKILGDTKKLEIQQSKLDIESRRVALLEAKAAAFDKIDAAANDDNLTAEQRLEQIRKGLKI